MFIQRRPSRRVVPFLIVPGLVALAGCANSPSPTNVAIQRGDAAATANEQRLAPMANRRQGLLVAGDGFGRMAYTAEPTVSTASADAE
ncbi:MAG: hypothetical protein IT438_06950 [Phycisphaerales bacterium]|nr:hypothetical protein [Phycisphaerales bacterium]